jgi:putative nucleotidyltransferase with HDIG domain
VLLMADDKPIPLRTFVYRTLTLRLGIVTLAIVLGVAAVVYVHQSNLFARQVAETAQNEQALLMERAVRIASAERTGMAESIPLALVERLAVPTARFSGRFVYVRISSPELPRPLEVADPDYALSDAAKAALRSIARSPVGNVRPELLRLDGHPVVRVLAPVPDLRDGQVELLFAISAPAIERARAASLTAIAIAIGVVLATVLLLYPVILHLVRRLANFSDALLEANFAALSMLGAAIALRDSDTDAHNYRVTLYAVRLGEAIGLAPEQMQALLKGAFLHDVGKIGIRDDILLKPGRLTEEEFAVMRSHVEQGVELVRRSRWLADAVSVVGAHHEKVDGSGYPNRATGGEIPITARIFAIVDVFDALTSRRPYKAPMTYEASVAILQQGRGRHFDSALLDAFLKVAPALYERYGGREDDDVKRDLEAVARRHFRAGLDTLDY